MEIHEKLEKARSAMRPRPSVSQIAHAAGIAVSTCHDYWKGKSPPSSENLKRLADVLGLTVEYLLDRNLTELPKATWSLEARVVASTFASLKLTQDEAVEALHTAARQRDQALQKQASLDRANFPMPSSPKNTKQGGS